MTTLLDTRLLPATERRAAWVDAHAEVLFPLHIDFATDGADFAGRMDSSTLGPLALLRVRGEATVVSRTARTIANADPEHLQVAVPIHGPCAVEQEGRATLLHRGDVACFDSSRPFRVPHGGAFDLLLLSLPLEVLGVPADHARARTALRISGTTGAGALLSSMLRQLWLGLEAGEIAPGTGPDVQDAVIALVGAVQRPALPERRPGASSPARLASAAKAYAERHLGDPDLGPTTIARAHHVSVRGLHAAFASEGDTVAGWIRRRRLERIRDALRDPALSHVSIARIAATWGMPNHSHFSRTFRREFGMPPRAARASG
jgi:AraC-like DNA-binding protein